MEITMTSGTRQREVNSPSAKTLPNKEKEKNTVTIQQDTYEPSVKVGFHTDSLQTASPDALFFDGELPPLKALETANFEVKDNIDWSWVKLRMSGSITMDDADSLIRKVDTIVSTYVGTKNYLEQTYAEHEDKLAENMAKLDAMFTQAKQRITSSYQSTIGNFYERLGNKGIRQDMGDSLSSAIDRRVEEMDKSVKESGILERVKDQSYLLIELSLDVKSLNEQDNGKFSGSVLEKGDEAYSLNDLQAAGIVAKTASSMNPKELQLMSDNELGIHLAVRYMKMTELLNQLGLDKEMLGFLQEAFGSYMDKYSDGALSDESRAFDAYHYTLKQYESSGDIKKVLEQSAKKYLGNSFFEEFQTDKDGIGTSKATRYRFELAQFSASLAERDLQGMISSIAGNRVYSVLAYA